MDGVAIPVKQSGTSVLNSSTSVFIFGTRMSPVFFSHAFSPLSPVKLGIHRFAFSHFVQIQSIGSWRSYIYTSRKMRVGSLSHLLSEVEGVGRLAESIPGSFLLPDKDSLTASASPKRNFR